MSSLAPSEAGVLGPTDAAADCSPALGNRVLAARLGYTAAQRGARLPEHHCVGGGRLRSFAYRMLGLSTGLHEGVLLGPGTIPLGEMTEFAGSIGATLLKVTRGAPAPAWPGEVHTERSRRWTIVRRSTRARELMPLAPTYDATLASFGRHTRRNIRAIRKVASDTSFAVETSIEATPISTGERTTLARRTHPNGVRLSLAGRLEAHADRNGRPFRSVVRAPDGEIISYACGYRGDPATAYLLYQLNNPDFHSLSPSLLHRAHLIEWLIDEGCDELVFVHGCTGVLRHACVRQPLEELLFMRRSPVSYLAASPIAFAKADSSLGRLVRAAVLPT